MKKNIVWSVIFVMLALMFTNLGCSFFGSRNAPPLSEKSGNLNVEDGINERIKSAYGTGTGTSTNRFDVYSQFVSDSTTGVTKENRNAVLSEIMGRSDKMFGEWRAKLQKSFVTRSNTFGLSALTLSTAGALTPTPLSNILSATSAAAQTADKLIDKVAFGDQSIRTIMNAIEIVRCQMSTTIDIKKTYELSEYSVTDAYSDAIAYHNTISLDVGINALTDATSTKLNQEKSVQDAVALAKTYPDKMAALVKARADNTAKNDSVGMTNSKIAYDAAKGKSETAKNASAKAIIAKDVADSLSKAAEKATETADKAVAAKDDVLSAATAAAEAADILVTAAVTAKDRATEVAAIASNIETLRYSTSAPSWKF